MTFLSFDASKNIKQAIFSFEVSNQILWLFHIHENIHFQAFCIEKKIVVILGGDGKGQDFSPLIDVVSKFVRSVVMIGKDKAVISNVLKNVDVPKATVDSMAQAVSAAEQLAKNGDVVLLSPACASLDMFDNYEHRGREFRAQVFALNKKCSPDWNEGVTL